ncbi:MAG: GYF domain-containing protein [Pirellulaceae bacterium]|nr:GYF domain-containing protein [Pirellulaceae bacterium]
MGAMRGRRRAGLLIGGGVGKSAMGIKFNCPNGHKLNVKSFLAGKKGVCPHCGAKFRIPNEPGDDDDDPPAPAQIVPGAAPPAAALPVPAIPGLPLSAAPAAAPAALPMPALPMGAAVPAGIPSAVVPTVPLGAAPAMALPMGAPVGAPVGRPATAVPVGMPAAGIALPAVVPIGGAVPLGGALPAARIPPVPITDPIAEAPAAVWYVRPPTGSQYGPARGDVMRKWITEGRVSADSLVWREGWPDWKNAGQLFPNLGAAGGGIGNAAGPPMADLGVPSRSARVTARAASKRKGSGALAVAALVLLAVVCVILVGVLVFVLTQ